MVWETMGLSNLAVSLQKKTIGTYNYANWRILAILLLFVLVICAIFEDIK
jgi:hypothetical protein